LNYGRSKNTEKSAGLIADGSEYKPYAFRGLQFSKFFQKLHTGVTEKEVGEKIKYSEQQGSEICCFLEERHKTEGLRVVF
jgi:hypothetical protein